MREDVLKLENFEQSMKVRASRTERRSQRQHLQRVGWERRTLTQGRGAKFASQRRTLDQEMIGAHWSESVGAGEKGLEIQPEKLRFNRGNRASVVRTVFQETK